MATRWVGTEVREHPVYDGSSGLDNFILSMEEKVVEDQRIPILDLSLQDTPTRWWANHKALLRNWDDVKKYIKYRFQDNEHLESEMQTDFQVSQLFNRESDPKAHIEQCVTQWQVAEIPSHFWVQVFPHSLGLILKTWFMHEETRRQTNDWKALADHFCKEFLFTSKYPELEVVLQRIKEFLFTDNSKQTDPVICAKHSRELQTNLHLTLDKKPIECYKIEKEMGSPDDLEELRNLAIKETEGNKEIQNIIHIQTDGSYNHPLKLHKVNIGTTEKPKIDMVGDYWDEKTSQEIQSLLQEYEDLFPNTFSSTQKHHMVVRTVDYQSIPGKLYKLGLDSILMRCVLDHERQDISWDFHNGVAGGHVGGKAIAQKVLEAGLWWATLFKDAKAYARSCDVFQRVGKPSRRDELPFQPV
jgi:hypothetical protein